MFAAVKRTFRFSLCVFLLSAFAAIVRPAQAALVFRDVNVTLDSSNLSSFDLDVDLDGTTDFTFTSAFVPDPVLPVGFDVVDFRFGSNNGVVIDAPAVDGFPSVSLLGVGNVVSSSSLFSSPNDQGNLTFFAGSDPPSGNFAGRSGYVGLRFDRLGGTAFGFADISVNAANAAVNPLGLTIRSVAFNDVLGAPAIITAVPEPSSMALAAVGLGLCGAFRMRKRAAALRKTNPV